MIENSAKFPCSNSNSPFNSWILILGNIRSNFLNIKYDEYQKIFDILLAKENLNTKINVFLVQKTDNVDIIHFNLDDDYSGDYKLSIVSLFRPNEEYIFFIKLDDNVNYFVGKKSDVWVKDTHLIIEYDSIIKDILKLIWWKH